MLNEEVFEMNVPNMKTKEEALSYLADKLISKGIVKNLINKQLLIESMFSRQDCSLKRMELLSHIQM